MVRGTTATLSLFVALGVLAVNALARAQVRAMTRFVEAGERTASPEKLSLGGKLHALAFGITVPRPRNARTPADVGLPYSVHRIPGSRDGRLEVWLAERREARGVVMLFHGYAGSKDQTLEAARAFFDLRWTCVLVDFRGSGGSDGKRTTLGYGEAADVAAVVNWAHERLGEARPVLYGLSMGSAALLRAVATEGVRPRAVILEAPFDRLLTTTAHRFESMGFPPVVSLMGAALLTAWGSIDAGFNGFTHNPMNYAARVISPALILCGAQDLHARETEARAVYRRLSGARSIAVFADARHGVTGVVPADQWREVVGAFLDTV